MYNEYTLLTLKGNKVYSGKTMIANMSDNKNHSKMPTDGQF
jgi:hypothetical protein